VFRKIIEFITEGKELILISLLFLGALLSFYGLVEFKDIKDLWQLKDPTLWHLRGEPMIPLIAIGMTVLVSSVIVTYLTKDKAKRRVPDISDYWHYHVWDSSNKSSHTGRCTIIVDSDKVKFDGIRCFVVVIRNGRQGILNVRWPWESSWSDYGEDGWLRCEYKFRSFNGYFKVRFLDQESAENEFEGIYYLLPDSFENEVPPPNAMYGTVKYQRVTKNEFENVSPPSGLEIWSN
jgi:hypothetical protein